MRHRFRAGFFLWCPRTNRHAELHRQPPRISAPSRMTDTTGPGHGPVEICAVIAYRLSRAPICGTIALPARTCEPCAGHPSGRVETIEPARALFASRFQSLGWRALFCADMLICNGQITTGQDSGRPRCSGFVTYGVPSCYNRAAPLTVPSSRLVPEEMT